MSEVEWDELDLQLRKITHEGNQEIAKILILILEEPFPYDW